MVAYVSLPIFIYIVLLLLVEDFVFLFKWGIPMLLNSRIHQLFTNFHPYSFKNSVESYHIFQLDKEKSHRVSLTATVLIVLPWAVALITEKHLKSSKISSFPNTQLLSPKMRSPWWLQAKPEANHSLNEFQYIQTFHNIQLCNYSRKLKIKKAHLCTYTNV